MRVILVFQPLLTPVNDEVKIATLEEPVSLKKLVKINIEIGGEVKKLLFSNGHEIVFHMITDHFHQSVGPTFLMRWQEDLVLRHIIGQSL